MASRCFLRSKIHSARLTATHRDYMGSISIDPELLRRADIAPFEQVDVYNVDNGERLTTYAIEGEPGEVCLNGAAALKGEAGQRVIIATFTWLDEDERKRHVPSVVLCGPGNVPMAGQ
ncbi:aspartate 1-decarboxylase [Desulfovibrio inopinatus]|uniref:aspartate 1-decarboxylase n=1 Tax=Desulfovibrio inopinatus TaxID=102109 RepID=UPI0003FF1ACF|nr:aspartate 1-decarboxylase [Desulfovibrio inopinatus]